MYMYIYIYMCVCVCVFVPPKMGWLMNVDDDSGLDDYIISCEGRIR